MIDGLSFLNLKWFWPVLVGSFLLWTVFVWKEWPQRREQRFWVKLLVSFIGLTSLMLMVLQPALPRKVLLGKGIVLTEGHRPQQLDSIKSLYKRIKVENYVAGKALSVLDKNDSLFVLGRGVQPFDMWQFEHRAINFLGGSEPEGLVDISHKRELLLGEVLSVKAKYQNPKQGHWAILYGPGGNGLDSIPLEEGTEQYIEFKTNTKASGRFVYSLMEKDTVGTVVSKEPIPVLVSAREPLNVLMVNNFPTFETKYLKNFLAEMGHGVLARTQLTKSKYKFEYFNREARPIYQLTPKNLESFDLIIIDTDSYIGLGSSSKTALEETVKEQGTGLFIQPSTSFFKLSQRQSPFRLEADSQTEFSFGEPVQMVKKYPYSFQNEFPLQPVFMDSVEVAAYIPMGKGKMTASTLQDTYHLILNGNQDLYTKLWTHILNVAVRHKEVVIQWQALTEIPRPDAPFEFQLRTTLENPSVETAQGANIPLLQDPTMPTLWNGIHYPRKTGWNHLEISGDSLSHYAYYVFDRMERKEMTQKSVLEANLRQFGKREGFNMISSATSKNHRPISLFWFFVPFLLCMGWLWLEPKLSNK